VLDKAEYPHTEGKREKLEGNIHSTKEKELTAEIQCTSEIPFTYQGEIKVFTDFQGFKESSL
jgi:hypothetical protein